MFTTSDIREISIQIERNGAEIYRSASRQIADPEMSRMMAVMADEELRHLTWFKDLDIGTEQPSEHPEIEAMGRALLQEMMESQTFSLTSDPLRAADDIVALLSQSLAFEEDTILFYNTLGAFIDDDETKKQLETIIGEERRHVLQIEKMKRSFGNDSGKMGR